MNNNNNNEVRNNLKNSALGSFITNSVDLWQQSARAWIGIHKEVAVSSQKAYVSWLDTLWKIIGTRQDQNTENLSYIHHDTYKKKRSLELLFYKEAEH